MATADTPRIPRSCGAGSAILPLTIPAERWTVAPYFHGGGAPTLDD